MKKKRPPQRRKSKQGGSGSWPLVVGVLVAGFLGWIAYEYLTLPDPSNLAKENPETTALIRQREEEAKEEGRPFRKRQYWIGLAQIPKHALDAVLLSEDAAFFQHDGVDRAELKKALVDAWEKGQLGRGASTITMQLAKNLWLSTDRSMVRKLKELILTARLEETLPKKRILTLYLNIAEWGDGVFGIEAGARQHFGVSAAELRPAQSAVLAVMLPAPRKWSPAKKSKQLHKRSLRLVGRMKSAGRLSAAEADAARAEIEQMFRGGDRMESPEEDAVGGEHLDAELEELPAHLGPQVGDIVGEDVTEEPEPPLPDVVQGPEEENRASDHEPAEAPPFEN